MELNQEIYSPKEVAEKLGITSDLLRKWVEEFNVIPQKTEKGHRRYTKENIELLMQIREKIQDQNWSWKQVGSWLNGEEEEFMALEEKSKIKDDLTEIKEMLHQQQQFNQAIVTRLDDAEKRNAALHTYIENELPNRIEIEKRDSRLLESLSESMENRKKEVEEKKEKESEKTGLISLMNSWFKKKKQE